MKLDEVRIRPIISTIDSFYGWELKDAKFTIRNSITDIFAEYKTVIDLEGITLPPFDDNNIQESTLEVTIKTKRPGLIIGKAGKDIKMLEEYLLEAFPCKGVKINIIENKLRWYAETEQFLY